MRVNWWWTTKSPYLFSLSGHISATGKVLKGMNIVRALENIDTVRLLRNLFPRREHPPSLLGWAISAKLCSFRFSVGVELGALSFETVLGCLDSDENVMRKQASYFYYFLSRTPTCGGYYGARCPLAPADGRPTISLLSGWEPLGIRAKPNFQARGGWSLKV